MFCLSFLSSLVCWRLRMEGLVSKACECLFLFLVLEMAAAAAIPVGPAEASCEVIRSGQKLNSIPLTFHNQGSV